MEAIPPNCCFCVDKNPTCFSRGSVNDYRIEVRGERREEHPMAYTRFHLRHIVTGRGLSEQALARAIELSDTKYCSVAATVRPTAEIVTSYELREA